MTSFESLTVFTESLIIDNRDLNTPFVMLSISNTISSDWTKYRTYYFSYYQPLP